MIIGAAALFGVISKDLGIAMFGALFGLSITWALQIANYLPMTVLLLSQIETNMNGCHRIFDYIDNTP